MPRKRFTSEQIIGKLREAEVALAKGVFITTKYAPHSALNGQPPAPETLLYRKDFTYTNLNAILT